MDDWSSVGTAAGTALLAGVDGRVGADLCRRIGKQKQQKDFGGLDSLGLGGEHFGREESSMDLHFFESVEFVEQSTDLSDFAKEFGCKSTATDFEVLFDSTDFEVLFDSTDFRVFSSACRMTRCHQRELSRYKDGQALSEMLCWMWT